MPLPTLDEALAENGNYMRCTWPTAPLELFHTRVSHVVGNGLSRPDMRPQIRQPVQEKHVHYVQEPEIPHVHQDHVLMGTGPMRILQ